MWPIRPSGINAGACKKCTSKAEAVENMLCFAEEVAGREEYLKLKCDYVLAGSIAAGSAAKEARHEQQVAQKTAAFLICSAKSESLLR